MKLPHVLRKRLHAAILTLVVALSAPAIHAQYPKPTFADVPYGPHKAQKLDFYQAKSDKPTPVCFWIHDGGWTSGSKIDERDGISYINVGISVVAIDYRVLFDAEGEGVVPPIKAPLLDIARALQFVRSKATEWNVDPTRIGVTGDEVGGTAALWLAFHPDFANPKSSDPIERESTRPWCAAASRAATTLDPVQIKEWSPNSISGFRAFGITADKTRKMKAFDVFVARRDSLLPWLAEYSPYALVSAGARPIYLIYDYPPTFGQEQPYYLRELANFGVKLQERCRKAGVECELVYPGAPDVKHATLRHYLIGKLKEKPGSE